MKSSKQDQYLGLIRIIIQGAKLNVMGATYYDGSNDTEGIYNKHVYVLNKISELQSNNYLEFLDEDEERTLNNIIDELGELDYTNSDNLGATLMNFFGLLLIKVIEINKRK